MRKNISTSGCALLAAKNCFISGVWEDGLPDSPWLSTGFGVVESVISVLLGLVDGISWLVSMRPLSILPAWMSNPAGACVHEKAALSCHRRALRDRLTLPASGSWLREPGMIVGAIDISCLFFSFWIRGVHHRAPRSGR